MNSIDKDIIELQEYHLDTGFDGEIILGIACYDPQCTQPHYMIKRVGEVFADVPATPVS